MNRKTLRILHGNVRVFLNNSRHAFILGDHSQIHECQDCLTVFHAPSPLSRTIPPLKNIQVFSGSCDIVQNNSHPVTIVGENMECVILQGRLVIRTIPE